MKVSLQDLRKMDSWKEVPQPEYCYHFSTKENIKKILQDGKVKQFNDFMTYFFYRLEDIPVYLDLTGAYHGRRAWNTKGQLVTYPPVIPAECAILKLYPSRREPLAWYEEQTASRTADAISKEIYSIFDSIRVCHYGSLSFKPDPEVIELSEVIEKYPYTRPEHLRPSKK